MIIELRGVEFVNKGAELMLYAILQEIKKEFPKAIFAMEHSNRAPRSKQLELGIYTKTNSRKYKGIGKVLDVIPSSIRRKMHYMSEDEIDVVLDGSGFAFGDFWGAKKAGVRLANHIESWKRKGKKVIMLPQALGPFTENDLIAKMKVILKNADLIFARDEYSFEYLKDISVNHNNVYLMPDFTNLIQGQKPEYFDADKHEIAIIPNSKLIESGVFDRGKYLEVLHQIAQNIKGKGFTPFFLVHEGKKDFNLVQEVNEKYNTNIEIINESQPLIVKGIIGNCKGVITSRFHGLVSSLAQSTPCLCIGWSHKYQALMEDYNYSEGLIKETELTELELGKKIDMILSDNSRKEVVSKLNVASKEQKEKSKQMWQKVFSVIRN